MGFACIVTVIAGCREWGFLDQAAARSNPELAGTAGAGPEKKESGGEAADSAGGGGDGGIAPGGVGGEAADSAGSGGAGGSAPGGAAGCGEEGCGCPEFWGGEDCGTCIVHVRADGEDSQTGGGWQSAKGTVQSAIETAAGRVEAGLAAICEVWVGSGRYVPSTPEGRDGTLQLSPAVHVYGGFSGNETSRDQRDSDRFETVLSGDVAEDDGPEWSTNRDDNLYHVVTGADEAVLDGFTVVGGHADDASGKGAGMLNDGASPTVANVTFRSNWARASGGGLYNQGGSPLIDTCKFFENAARFGGAIYNAQSSPEIRSCAFVENRATTGSSDTDPRVTQSNGGAIFNQEATPTVRDSQFVENRAETYGGGLLNNLGSKAVVLGSTFEGNVAIQGGGVLSIDSQASVASSTFLNNRAEEFGGGIVSIRSTLESVESVFSDNESGRGGGMYLSESVAEVIDCSFEGNEADQGGAMENWASSPLIRGCSFVENEAEFGGAVVNMRGVIDDRHEPSNSVIVESVFSKNLAGQGAGIFNSNSDPYVASCRFEANAAEYGGAMVNEGASPEITSCFFGANGAYSSGGAIYSVAASTLLITNSTFAANLVVLASEGTGWTLHTVDSTLIATNCIIWGEEGYSPMLFNENAASLVTYSTIMGGCSASCTSDPTGNTTEDPLFVDVATGDFRLQASSPCINAGSNAAVGRDEHDVDDDGDVSEPPPDAEGANRIIGDVVDMGAYEHSP